MPAIGPEFKDVLLFVAVAGLLLLFASDWTVRVAGVLLMLPRFFHSSLTTGEWMLFGSGVAAAVSRVVYGWSFAPNEPADEAPTEPELPEPDDVTEPATCVACRGSIPAGENKCPQCGWSYTSERE